MDGVRLLEIAICDNNIHTVSVLEDCIKQILPYASVRKYENEKQLLADLNNEKYDCEAVFLAIRMPDLNGIDTAKKIRQSHLRLPVIFVSESDEYYRAAFDVFAFQYLLQPFSLKAVEGVLKRLKEIKGLTEEGCVHFRYRSQLYTVRHSDISYISSSLHIVTFHLFSGETLCCRGKLSDFEDQLTGGRFFRCHQSFYVNLDAVMGMKNSSFLLKDQEIPISRTYCKEACRQYQEYLNGKNAKIGEVRLPGKIRE